MLEKKRDLDEDADAVVLEVMIQLMMTVVLQVVILRTLILMFRGLQKPSPPSMFDDGDAAMKKRQIIWYLVQIKMLKCKSFKVLSVLVYLSKRTTV